jgi:autotransporter-associated beta strand protein
MQLQGSVVSLGTAVLGVALWPLGALGQTAQDIRLVTFNTQGDESSPSPTGVLPYLATVLEGVGEQQYAGDGILQLPDIIALQETTSNSVTVSPLTTELNNYYGSDVFGYSTYQATTSDGNTDGGGPNGLIYNQNTLNLVASVGVGTPESGTNGEFRQVVRYEFQPLVDKGTNNGVFYVYDTHMKSGSAGTSADGSTDGALRNGEALIIRNDEAENLPANAAVIYVGDFNMDGSTEAAYQTMTAADSPGGVDQGQGIDPLNPTDNYTENWSSATYKGILTEKDSKLEYRDDLQLMTSNVYDDAPGTLDYISGSLHAFGNNGTAGYEGNVDSNSNTALDDLVVGSNGPTASQVVAAMNPMLGSDHLPVVADYSIAIGPFTLTWDNLGGTGDGTTWDTTSQNWNNGGGIAIYGDGENVIFNDSNNGNYAVTLNTDVQPGSVLINSSGNYIIGGSGSIAGTGSLTKSNTGTATLSTVNSYTGGTNVTAGTLIIGANGALPDDQAVTVSGGLLQLAHNTGGETVSFLTITGGGTFDITNNHIVIDYADPADRPNVDGAILGYITSGSIFSSESNGSYGVGWADGNDASESGIVSANSVLVAYTLYGDANLDGSVNSVDFGDLAANFGKSGKIWDEGDFNYDGVVNSVDFGVLAGNFGKSDGSNADVVSAADWAALDAFAAANGLMADVPEPGPAILLLPAGAFFMSRQRRARSRRV